MSKDRKQNTNKIRSKPKIEGQDLQPPNIEKAAADATGVPKINTPRPKTKSKLAAKKTVSVTEDPQPQNPLPEMEVHYHPQLDHNSKPWKEYLIEGFMIFIAVMMGFIAENIREDITNNQHVKQLTAQLVHDLKDDTAQLNEISKKETNIRAYNDSLLYLSQQPLAKIDIKKLQYLAVNSHSMWPFHPSEGAITAIKNELHLKQFSNSDLISLFAQYEKDVELLHTAQEINLQYQRTYLDPFLTQHFTPANLNAAFKNLPLPDAQLRNLSQQDLMQLGTDMALVRVVTNEMLKDNTRLKKDANNLLQYVKSQYDLKDK